MTSTILKTDIAVANMPKVVDYLCRNIGDIKGKYICVSNVHTTVMAFRDEAYRCVQNGALLALPDGKPLSMVSRRRGFRGAKRVPGPDLMAEMFKISAEKGFKHYFYGSTEETLAKLKENLEKEYPGIDIAGMYSPPFRPLTDEEDAECIKRINESGADFIWVGLGAPKQEKWMAAHENKVNGLMLGVGAGFDFHAGTVKRAPKWIQELCLEWLYRLFQDPKRLFKRYLSTNLTFIIECAKEGRKVRKDIRREHKKIAMIGHKRIPSREGGVEIVVEQLSVRFARLGMFVDAYNRSGYHVSGKEFDTRHNKIFKDVRIITVPTFQNGKLNAIVYTFLATLRALFGKYDVYHFHAEGPCAFLWILKLFGKKIVVTIHGLDWQRSKWGNFASRVLKYGEKSAAKYADRIIVLSHNVEDYFLDTYKRKTIYVPNGIERPTKVPAKEITEKWGIEPQKYILFLARIVPEKGLHYLMDAYEQMDTDLKLVIAGGGSHSNEYMNSIIERAEKNPNIVMTHFVQGRQLEELFSNAYIFVLPSDIEGMAISLLEAMSYGNCCLVSDIPENTEVVEDCAATFKKGDSEDLKRALTELIDNPAKVSELKNRSSDFICEKYSWDKVTDETLKIYEEVMNGSDEYTYC